MFRNNYPVTVSSDDPAFWNALPLTHDMLAAFLFLMSEQQGVRALKAVIENSFKYSCLSEQEKTMAMKGWQIEWEILSKKLLEKYGRTKFKLKNLYHNVYMLGIIY